MNPLDILEQSKCFNCKHRFSRVITPVTQEDIDYYLGFLEEDEEDEEGINDDYELQIEQHICLITNEDIDGIIIECSHFEPINNMKLIREYKF